MGVRWQGAVRVPLDVIEPRRRNEHYYKHYTTYCCRRRMEQKYEILAPLPPPLSLQYFCPCSGKRLSISPRVGNAKCDYHRQQLTQLPYFSTRHTMGERDASQKHNLMHGKTRIMYDLCHYHTVRKPMKVVRSSSRFPLSLGIQVRFGLELRPSHTINITYSIRNITYWCSVGRQGNTAKKMRNSYFHRALLIVHGSPQVGPRKQAASYKIQTAFTLLEHATQKMTLLCYCMICPHAVC